MDVSSQTIDTSLGQLLRESRRAAGWTQRQLADAARVSVGVVRDLEQGISQRPRPDSLRRLAGALGVPGDDLAVRDPGSVEPVTIQVLGPLRVWRHGIPLPLGGGKQRAVLGLLGLHPDTVVSRGAIGAVLWGDNVPHNSAPIIQSHVSRLRTALEPVGPRGKRDGLLGTAGAGYFLRSDRAMLDLVTYRRLAERARTALRAGDAAVTCELFEQALDAWRDEPAADVELLAGHPWVTSLQLQRAELLVEYAEAASGQGWHDRVLPHLQALAEHDPLNERAHACLMIALAGAGRQAAALELYARLRRRLNDQLGVPPGAALAAAHLQVLRHQIPARAAPRHTASLSPPAGPARLPRPFQLPPAVADFTGRAEQIGQLDAMLRPDGSRSAVPVVVISGPPGAGKSALMVQAGHALRPSFPDGQLWAALDGASGRPRDPGDVLGEFLRAMGVTGPAVPDGIHERAAFFRSRLADRRVLVALDDAASAAQVLSLLPGTAGCAAVLTSRRQLIELPGSRLIPLGPLSPAEAAELLGRIAGAQWIGAEPDAAAELAAGCGQLPLALRIAGAKLAARGIASIAVLARAVADERNRLDALQIGDLSIRASLASGYQSLSSGARRAFRLLALLGACDVAEWTVAALLGDASAAQAVNELCDRSMLTVAGVDHAGQVRYRLHDLLRDYAGAELARETPASRDMAVGRAHSAWLQLASLASARLPRDPYFPAGTGIDTEASAGTVLPAALAAGLTAHPLAWFEAERLNLMAAVSAACAAGQHTFAAGLATSQSAYQHIQGRYDDAEAMWRQVAAAADRAGDATAGAHARLRFGAAMSDRTCSVDALRVLTESVEVLDQGPDSAALAMALYWRAGCSWDLGRYEQSCREARRGVRIARRAGSRPAECMNLRLLAQSLVLLGRPGEGIGAAEDALAIARELADDSYLKVALHNLAMTCVNAGQYERAVAVCEQNRELCQRLGDGRLAALTLGVLGDAYYGLGRHREAIGMFSTALPAFQEYALSRFEALCLLKLGYAHQALDEHAQAIQDVQRSLPIFRQLNLAHYEERAHRVLDACLASGGE